MTKRTQFEKLAEAAAERILASADMAQQLTLLPHEAEAETAASGRGRGKRKRGLGQWLAAQGYHDPGERLAELANLNTDLDPLTAAIARAEQAAAGLGITDTESRVALFQTMFAAQLRALEAVMPYIHAKAATEAPPPPAVQVFVQQGPGDGAKVVDATPVAPGLGLSFAPPPLPGEIQQNQEDSE